MSWNLVREHYSRLEVRREIAEYSRGRWVAIHCMERDERGLPIMIRYRGKKPLTIGSGEDVLEVIRRFSKLKPRAFYATAHLYRRLESGYDVADRSNIIRSSPTWDIDSLDGDWRKVVGKALEILDVLDRYGVTKSVFFKWSGRGAHIQINPNAFSEDILGRIDPLDIAYSVTEYVIRRIEPGGGVRVENKIDVQRVFTIPLSLHRSVDRVAVCMPPDRVEEFHLDWADPRSYKHYPDSWRRFEKGEGDELAERAYDSMGPYIVGRRKRRKHKPLDQEILETLKKFDAD